MITAVQGGLGLELARTHAHDRILPDLHLPDMSGEDVATALRANGHPERRPYSSRWRMLLTLGVNAYITKLFKAGELIALTDSTSATISDEGATAFRAGGPKLITQRSGEVAQADGRRRNR